MTVSPVIECVGHLLTLSLPYSPTNNVPFKSTAMPVGYEVYSANLPTPLPPAIIFNELL